MRDLLRDLRLALRTLGKEPLVVAGELVPSGGPSCISCARDLLVSGRVAAVWLFHEAGWRRYPIEEFHRLTMDACGIASEASEVSP